MVKADASTWRSVYLPLLRGLTPRSLEAFDPVEQTLVTGQRQTTTVPSQALYLLNSPFVRKAAPGTAQRVLNRADTDAGRVRELYRLVLGRVPTPGELARTSAFLAEYESAQRALDPSPSPELQLTHEVVVSASAPPKKEPANPDEADQADEPVREQVVRVPDARTAAWHALAQALFSSAEFRYVQ